METSCHYFFSAFHIITFVFLRKENLHFAYIFLFVKYYKNKILFELFFIFSNNYFTM